jgi:hypothetical protein
MSYRPPHHFPRRPAPRGQAITELALIVPVIALILLALVVFSNAFSVKMDVQAANAQGARLGGLRGNSATGANPDTTIVTSILNSHGIDARSISQIQIFRAAADGSIDYDYLTTPPTPLVDTYAPPYTNFDDSHACPSAASGLSAPAGATCHWPYDKRQINEPSDALGVHITYLYHPLITLGPFSTITMNDNQVVHLNPPQGAVPCPYPGLPTGIRAVTHSDSSGSNVYDTVSWDAVSSALSYMVYYGTGFASSAPVPTGTSTNVSWTSLSAAGPGSYQVASINTCGPGTRSSPPTLAYCPPPPTPTNLTVTPDASTPGQDDITWTPDSATNPAVTKYDIVQTLGGVTTRLSTASTPATMSHAGYAPASYTIDEKNACGVSAKSPPVLVTPPSPPQMNLAISDDAGGTGATPGHIGPSQLMTYTLSLSNQATDSAAVAQNVKLVATLDSNIDTSTGKVSCIVATAPTPLTLSDFACTQAGSTFTIALVSGKAFPAKGATATIMIQVATPTTVASISTSGTLTYQGSTGTPPPVSDNDVIVSAPSMDTSTEGDNTGNSKQVSATSGVKFTINLHETNPAPSAVATAVKVTAMIDPLLSYDASVGCHLSGSATGTCVPDPTDPSHKLIITLTNSVTHLTSGRIIFGAKLLTGTTSGQPMANSAVIAFSDGAGVAQTPFTANNRTLTTN